MSKIKNSYFLMRNKLLFNNLFLFEILIANIFKDNEK